MSQAITLSGYTLIYIERSNRSEAHTNIKGPKLFLTYEDALAHLMKHVADRINECCKDEFLEWAESHLPKSSVENCNKQTQDLKLIDILGKNHYARVIDWYFEYMNDELCESFYDIKQHQVSLRVMEEDRTPIQSTLLNWLSSLPTMNDLNHEELNEIGKVLGFNLNEVSRLLIQVEKARTKLIVH